MKRIVYVLAAVMLLNCGSIAFSETRPSIKTIQATGKYVMGDQDSKSAARKLAILQAKQTALEEAGTYLTSVTEVRDLELSKDEITSLAAGVMSVKVLDEKWAMMGEAPVVTVKIEAVIDTSGLSDQVKDLKGNKEEVEGYKELQAELARLKKDLDELKKQETETSSTDKPSDVQVEAAKKKKGTINKILAIDIIKNAGWEISYGDPYKAVADLEEAIKLAPKSTQGHYVLARAYQKIGDNKKALKSINTALELDPDSFKNWALHSRILYGLGRHQKALNSANKAIEMNPECGKCFQGRAMLHKKLGNYKKVFKDLQKACKLGIEKTCLAVERMKARGGQDRGNKGKKRKYKN